jgi:hypothetical protein
MKRSSYGRSIVDKMRNEKITKELRIYVQQKREENNTKSDG